MTRRRRSILIVDDLAAQRLLLRAVFEEAYCVMEVASVQEAEALLRDRRFDLVIIDQKMPEGCGVELIEWIKRNLPQSPVILLTAFADDYDSSALARLGADHYVSKPIESPAVLRSVVSRVIQCIPGSGPLKGRFGSP